MLKKICAALMAASLALTACAVSVFAQEATADKYGVVASVTGAQIAEDESWTWDNGAQKKCEEESLFMGAPGDTNAGNFNCAKIGDMLDGKELADGTYKIVFLAHYTFIKDKTEPFIIKLYDGVGEDQLRFTQSELQQYDGQPISMTAVVNLSSGKADEYTIGGWHSSAFGGKIDKVILASSDCDVISAFPEYTSVKEAVIGGTSVSGTVDDDSWKVSDGKTTYAPDVTGITLDKNNASVEVGEKITLKATVQPADAGVAAEWASLNEDIATVDQNGVVTGLKEGTATIKASAGGFEAVCFVEVVKKPVTVAVTGVKTSKSSVKLVSGKSATVSATVSPANATDKTLVWSTSNAKVATVANGKITAKNPGKAVITVKVGGKTASVNVTVSPKQVSGVKVTAKKGKAVIKFKAVTGAQKYQVVFTSGKKATKKIVKKSGQAVKIKKGSYKVKVRAYGGGQYGKYSKNVSVKVK